MSQFKTAEIHHANIGACKYIFYDAGALYGEINSAESQTAIGINIQPDQNPQSGLLFEEGSSFVEVADAQLGHKYVSATNYGWLFHEDKSLHDHSNGNGKGKGETEVLDVRTNAAERTALYSYRLGPHNKSEVVTGQLNISEVGSPYLRVSDFDPIKQVGKFSTITGNVGNLTRVQIRTPNQAQISLEKCVIGNMGDQLLTGVVQTLPSQRKTSYHNGPCSILATNDAHSHKFEFGLRMYDLADICERAEVVTWESPNKISWRLGTASRQTLVRITDGDITIGRFDVDGGHMSVADQDLPSNAVGSIETNILNTYPNSSLQIGQIRMSTNPTIRVSSHSHILATPEQIRQAFIEAKRMREAQGITDDVTGISLVSSTETDHEFSSNQYKRRTRTNMRSGGQTQGILSRDETISNIYDQELFGGHQSAFYTQELTHQQTGYAWYNTHKDYSAERHQLRLTWLTDGQIDHHILTQEVVISGGLSRRSTINRQSYLNIRLNDQHNIAGITAISRTGSGSNLVQGTITNDQWQRWITGNQISTPVDLFTTPEKYDINLNAYMKFFRPGQFLV